VTTTKHHVVIDTSLLRNHGLEHPDFQKLLLLAAPQDGQEPRLKIYIPYIVWEEFRTQQTEKALEILRQARQAVENLNSRIGSRFPLKGLSPAELEAVTPEMIEACSTEEMDTFAKTHNIEIVPLASDHAQRAWRRYFRGGKRRTDIPDNWILESVLDLKARHAALIALCQDKPFAGALRAESIHVVDSAQGLLDIIEPSQGALQAGAAQVQGTGTVLAQVQSTFQGQEAKVFGFISYLAPAPKEKLFALLDSAGITREVALNVAERLRIAGVITDTGNHYLPRDRNVAEAAAAEVEPDIIALMGR
jgi:hypothetical protein